MILSMLEEEPIKSTNSTKRISKVKKVYYGGTIREIAVDDDFVYVEEPRKNTNSTKKFSNVAESMIMVVYTCNSRRR